MGYMVAMMYQQRVDAWVAVEVARGAADGFLVVVEQWRLVVILGRVVILWRRRLRMKLQDRVGDNDGDSGGA
jgi:hypothetical protein